MDKGKALGGKPSTPQKNHIGWWSVHSWPSLGEPFLSRHSLLHQGEKGWPLGLDS